MVTGMPPCTCMSGFIGASCGGGSKTLAVGTPVAGAAMCTPPLRSSVCTPTCHAHEVIFRS
jgi:hypothetical protein